MWVVFLQVQPCLGEWNIVENQPMKEEVINNVEKVSVYHNSWLNNNTNYLQSFKKKIIFGLLFLYVYQKAIHCLNAVMIINDSINGRPMLVLHNHRE